MKYDLTQEEKFHIEVAEWIENQGWDLISLDDLIFENDHECPFMNMEQREQAQEFMETFNLL